MKATRRVQQLQQVLVKERYVSSTFDSHVIQVSPEVSLLDQKVHITLQGLPAQSKFTVFALTENVWQEKPVQFASCGHYTTSQSGNVDLQRDASVGGTYTGVEPMGLFWSMKPNPFGPQFIRLVKRNVMPLLYKLSVYHGHLSLDDLFKGKFCSQPLSTRTVERRVLAVGVRGIPVEEGRLRGMVFLPPGEGPFPGVVDIDGMAGGLMETRAALLASHGFAVFALAFFGYKDLPASPEKQTSDYFETAARWFSSHPAVAAGGIGVMGRSGGTGYGLIMAYRCSEVKAFVWANGQAFHSFMDMEDTEHVDQHFRTGVSLDMTKCSKTEEGLVMKDAWVLDDNQIIPLWKKDVHVLAVASDDDGQADPWVMDKICHLYPEERRHLLEVVHYPHAGHLLELPSLPLCRACYSPFFDAVLVWGGYVPEHAAAQEDAWERICQFFQKHLPSSSLARESSTSPDHSHTTRCAGLEAGQHLCPSPALHSRPLSATWNRFGNPWGMCYPACFLQASGLSGFLRGGDLALIPAAKGQILVDSWEAWTSSGLTKFVMLVMFRMDAEECCMDDDVDNIYVDDIY